MLISFKRYSLKRSVLQKKSSPAIEIVLFFHNSTSNRSESIRFLSQKLNIMIFYNAKSTPQLNIVKQYFEFDKKNIRTTFFSSDFETIKEFVRNSTNYNLRNPKLSLQKELKTLFKILKKCDI